MRWKQFIDIFRGKRRAKGLDIMPLPFTPSIGWDFILLRICKEFGFEFLPIGCQCIWRWNIPFECINPVRHLPTFDQVDSHRKRFFPAWLLSNGQMRYFHCVMISGTWFRTRIRDYVHTSNNGQFKRNACIFPIHRLRVQNSIGHTLCQFLPFFNFKRRRTTATINKSLLNTHSYVRTICVWSRWNNDRMSRNVIFWRSIFSTVSPATCYDATYTPFISIAHYYERIRTRHIAHNMRATESKVLWIHFIFPCDGKINTHTIFFLGE